MLEETSMTAAAPGCTITVADHDAEGAWLIALGGEHDLSTAPLIHEATRGVWACATRGVVDLSGADFIDSTVINWLVSTKRALEASGTRTLAIVVGPPNSVAARLFGLLSLPEVPACYATREDAFAHASADLDTARPSSAGAIPC
jgi:anti-anti-sigma regulatory factor